jgi:hypothetical protein
MGGYRWEGAKQVNLVQNYITVTLRYRKNIFGQNEQSIQVQDATAGGWDRY